MGLEVFFGSDNRVLELENSNGFLDWWVLKILKWFGLWFGDLYFSGNIMIRLVKENRS